MVKKIWEKFIAKEDPKVFSVVNIEKSVRPDSRPNFRQSVQFEEQRGIIVKNTTSNKPKVAMSLQWSAGFSTHITCEVMLRRRGGLPLEPCPLGCHVYRMPQCNFRRIKFW